MTARKPLTEPIIGPEIELGNYLTSRHDQAISEIAKLDGQIENRKEYYARERKRLDSQEAQEMMSLHTQRGQNRKVADMALAAISVGKDEVSEGIRLVVGQ